jgi:2-C-methyl-D-erythritol 2,4-cyclodiphosphate synthase
MADHSMRIGQGWYIHQMVEGRPLVLGGLTIPFDRGPLGHSDGDVLIHAIIDALLGALCLGDIGQHFPPADERYKGANSLDMLAQVKGLVSQEGYTIGNIDSTIILEKPKLAPHLEAMRRGLAQVLNCQPAQISIKAKTHEGLDELGKGNAVACQAVALLFQL